MGSFSKVFFSSLIYYFLRATFPLIKSLFNFLVNIKLINNKIFIDKVLYQYFRFFAYHGFLITDLERYMDVGKFRIQMMKKLGQWEEQRKFKNKKTLRIGFIGNLANESLLSKDFFCFGTKNFEIYLYDMGTKTNIYNDYMNIYYKNTPPLEPYQVSRKNYDIFLNMLEKDSLDILIILSNTYFLPILDKLTIPSIIPMNTTSTLMPHLKCIKQFFVQPSCPYVIKKNRIFNLRLGTYFDFPYVENSLFYNYRAAKVFVKKELKDRQLMIFFTGNLNKIDSPVFFDVLITILQNNKKVKFIYYGQNKNDKVSQLEKIFKRNNVIKQTRYAGKYISQFDKSGNLIDDGVVYNAYTELFLSRLFMNTFPIYGARSCIEAYVAQVPTIHLDLDENDWINNQKLQSFKIPIILTKSGTAKSVTEYQEKCLKVLTDDKFCQTIIEEQNELLKQLTNIEFFWNKILDIVKEDIELRQ